MRIVPAIGLFLSRDHAKQRRLAGAVRTDHADDAAGRQRERHVFDQQIVAVAFVDAFRFDHDVAQARPGRNVNLQIFAPLLVTPARSNAS